MSNTLLTEQATEMNKYLKEYLELAEYIRQNSIEFDSEDLLLIQRELAVFEENLKATFAKWINPTMSELTPVVEFLNTEDFLNRSGLVDTDSMPEDTLEQITIKAQVAVKQAKKAIKIQGVRSIKNGNILVHTTDYENSQPHKLSVSNATYKAMHEVAHGYVDPQLKFNDQKQLVERQTGCKRIIYNPDGTIKEVEHAELYEVMNDIAVVLANPHIQSWDEVIEFFKKKYDFLGLEHTSNIIEFCTLMKSFANGDFNAGKDFIGKTHFHFDKEVHFVETLVENLPEKFREKVRNHFKNALKTYVFDIFTTEFRVLVREMQKAA